MLQKEFTRLTTRLQAALGGASSEGPPGSWRAHHTPESSSSHKALRFPATAGPVALRQQRARVRRGLALSAARALLAEVYIALMQVR